MIGKLEFNLPEEKKEFEDAQKGTHYQIIIDEIWEKVFRPHFKHGYTDGHLQETIERSPDAAYVVKKLAELYQEVLKDNNYKD